MLADVLFSIAGVIGYLGGGIFVGKLVWIYHYDRSFGSVTDTQGELVFIVFLWPLVALLSLAWGIFKGIIALVTYERKS